MAELFSNEPYLGALVRINQDNFFAGVTAAVNHSGDSDSMGAVMGNILGSLCGYEAIEEKCKRNLDFSDVILEMEDDLC